MVVTGSPGASMNIGQRVETNLRRRVDALFGWARRPRLRQRTVRLRLTLLYGALFLASGAALLAITYVLAWNATTVHLPTGRKSPGQVVTAPAAQRRAELAHQHAVVMHQLLESCGIALAVTAVLSITLGWLVAGRVLRPIRTMTAATQRISDQNLHQRLSVAGPDDELKRLGDTIDGLLARLESAFEAQRRFVANASHELRTPLTLEQAMLEAALADPDATAGTLRVTCENVLVASRQQGRLIEALLTLARSQRGLEHSVVLDLGVVTE